MTPAMGALKAEIEPLRRLFVCLLFRFSRPVLIDRGVPFGDVLGRPGALVPA